MSAQIVSNRKMCGVPETLCEWIGGAFGAHWGSDGRIYCGHREGIMSVSANGGSPDLLVPAGVGEFIYGPQLLPDGKSLLFSLTTAEGATRWDQAQVFVQSLESGDRKLLVDGASDARYVPRAT